MKGDVELIATPSQTVGPFFHVAFTPQPAGGMAKAFGDGERIQLRIVVTDGDDRPVDDAVLELWHTSTGADASVQGGNSQPTAGFGRIPTNGDGACQVDTVRPGRTADSRGKLQAPHISVCLFARGLLRQLHTRIYFTGDPALADDPVLALVAEDRRSTLLAHRDAGDAGSWVFHVRLQGPHETVFFDP
jgi:protocatechuate 3,4-dioxygenase alpha subunit